MIIMMIETDREVLVNRPDRPIIVKNKKDKTCLLIDYHKIII
jgi:hypothetical protein